MQLKKILKGALIALPVVTMMACTSTGEEEMTAAEAERLAAEQREAERLAREAEEASVQTGSVLEVPTAQEIREQKLEELSRNQVVYFDFDRASIRSDSFTVLNLHADFLSKNPEQAIVVEGHCDSRGTPEYNIALGERRAKAIETYLLNAGVNGEQISIVSYGEEKPIALGSSESAFAQNRRGVLVYR